MNRVRSSAVLASLGVPVLVVFLVLATLGTVGAAAVFFVRTGDGMILVLGFAALLLLVVVAAAILLAAGALARGSTDGAHCVTCGTRNPAGANYCTQCGTPLPPR